MKKIQTIFERDHAGNKGVIPVYIKGFYPELLVDAIATEKLDGTNVRVTVRSGLAVRLEKRKNPSKEQKALGITEPWYAEAYMGDPQDKWILDAYLNTNYLKIPDGEWSGEAVGKNIQGNPLNLDNNRIAFFSLKQVPAFCNVPVDFDGLKDWLPKQKSLYGYDCGIEGIVWHCPDGSMYKIKTKDFR